MIIYNIENTETKNSVKITIKNSKLKADFSASLNKIKKDEKLRQSFVKLMISLWFWKELEKELLKFINK